MFEPVHGSAPNITGKGIANPIGQVWSGTMVFDHLGHHEAAMGIEGAMESALGDQALRTPDMGGKATTEDLGKAIAAAIQDPRLFILRLQRGSLRRRA